MSRRLATAYEEERARMQALLASEDLFARIDVAYLDCVADNLALVLLHLGCRDVRTPFACQWHFDFDDAQQALPVLCRDSWAEIIAQQTGCRLHQQPLAPARCLETLGALLAAGQPALVFGNSWFIPWQPYFGRAAQEHSFVVDGISADGRRVHIADAHENRTEWGEARPTSGELPALALPVILETQSEHAGTLFLLERMGEAPQPDVRALLLANAQQVAQAQERGRFRAFADRYAQQAGEMQAARRFELALWLVARARALHALWLRDLAGQWPQLLPPAYPERYEQEVVLPWRRAREQAYLLQRRLARGRPAPGVCFTMIAEEIGPREAALAEELRACLQGA